MKRFLIGLLLVLGLTAGLAFAQSLPTVSLTVKDGAAAGKGELASTIKVALLFTLLALTPAILMLMTSFTRVIVSFHFLKQAIGLQGVPPNQVLIGLALFITLFIMTPVGRDVYDNIKGLEGGRDMFSQSTVTYAFKAADLGKEPVRTFLLRHSGAKDRALFVELAQRLAKDPEKAREVGPKDFQVIIPAFVISELKEAFLIGFIIYIPFVVIDMIVANILTAMGMMMLSPTTISLPFKLLLFVLVDGWYLIVRGLVLSYL